MLCRTCTAIFNKQDRNKHLADFSIHENSSKCLTCLIEGIKIKQSKRYRKLAKQIRKHEQIKALYYHSTKKVSSLDDQFRSMDYERNMILHSIRQEQEQIKVKATRKKPSRAKEPKITPELIKTMLANLTPEQQAKVMANYIKTQSS